MTRIKYKEIFLQTEQELKEAKQKIKELLKESKFQEAQYFLWKRERESYGKNELFKAAQFDKLQGKFEQLEWNFKNLLIATDRELAEHRRANNVSLF